MSTITQHAPGTFCWFELATTDHDAGNQFYSKLFGWEVDTQPAGPGMTYTIHRLAGRDAAAAHGMAPPHYPAGTPSHWLAYLAVENVDETLEKVKAAGGKVLTGPFDVMDYGRMGVCQDPAGATFAIWQARKNTGVGVTGEPGSFGWCQ